MSEDITINRWLKDSYGNVPWADLPRYRVVWTTGLTEKRFIKDRQVFSGPIYLRTETGVFTVPKYPFAKDRWALECCMHLPPEYGIVDANHTYEPIFVMQDNKGNFLPLERRAIAIIVFFHQHPDLTRLSPTDVAEMEKRIDAQEVAEFEAKLENEMSDPYQIDLIE
jgi:hypothetical protein